MDDRSYAEKGPHPEGEAGPSVRTLRVLRLGRVDYGDALTLQAELVAARREGAIPDTLVLLEHPDVVTLGTSSSPEHLLIDREEFRARGIDVVEVGRGGDVTYHGPGQLVGYPILALAPDRRDLHRYLRDLEEVLIRALAGLGVPARRLEGLTGVWAGRGKIAAIGVRVSSGWITSHGFALNVSTELSRFETIVPCGISDRAVSSLALESGRPPDAAAVERAVTGAFREVFGYEPRTTGETGPG